MRLWMYGCGADPVHGARRLARLGFSAVAGGPELIGAAAEYGLDCYLCTGAFGYNGDFKREEYLTVDVNGDRRLWFGSTCPTNPGVRARNLEDIKQLAANRGVKGILIDGCRFASPASSDDIEAFFTCFCDGCMTKARGLGFDAGRMHAAARELYRLYRGEGNAAAFAERHASGLADWFAFRRAATTEHLIDFIDVVKSAGLLAGIYIFTPSLSFLVGQNYTDLADKMDIIAPMVYRKYKEPHGPACLNHEWGAVYKILHGVCGDRRAGGMLSAMLGYPVTADIVDNGFDTGIVYDETKRAADIAGGEKTAPIILLDDDDVSGCLDACRRAGAETAQFFLYDEALLTAAEAQGAFSV